FSVDAKPPKWVAPGPTPEPVDGQVTMAGYLSGWCPAMNLTYERSKRVAEDLGDPVVFVPIDISDPAAIRRHGHADVVFLDGKQLQRGAPPSYDKIRKKTIKRLRRVARS
ncbi:MAG: hypothetical protein KJO18_06740, partial [Acidimicrobiia bacterium]|nr:hypothetical protein [Acidimicrobiia bacterium]